MPVTSSATPKMMRAVMISLSCLSELVVASVPFSIRVLLCRHPRPMD